MNFGSNSGFAGGMNPLLMSSLLSGSSNPYSSTAGLVGLMAGQNGGLSNPMNAVLLSQNSATNPFATKAGLMGLAMSGGMPTTGYSPLLTASLLGGSTGPLSSLTSGIGGGTDMTTLALLGAFNQPQAAPPQYVQQAPQYVQQYPQYQQAPQPRAAPVARVANSGNNNNALMYSLLLKKKDTVGTIDNKNDDLLTMMMMGGGGFGGSGGGSDMMMWKIMKDKKDKDNGITTGKNNNDLLMMMLMGGGGSFGF